MEIKQLTSRDIIFHGCFINVPGSNIATHLSVGYFTLGSEHKNEPTLVVEDGDIPDESHTILGLSDNVLEDYQQVDCEYGDS